MSRFQNKNKNRNRGSAMALPSGIINDKIIVALDTDDLGKAKQLVKTLRPRVKFFKIGLEMINTGQAPELIEFIHKLSGEVFYDIKLNDIPNTVGKTAKVVSKLGVWGFTVHASAGKEAVKAAVENKGGSRVFGVTVLTSIDNPECTTIFGEVSNKKVIQFAEILVKEKCAGVVCSPQEAGIIKNLKKFSNLTVITPGIRPIWAKGDEQKRMATPGEAIISGADYLVIGRPITNPPKKIGNSKKALDRIIEEIKS